MNQLNDIAIFLTKKIESKLLDEFFRSNGYDLAITRKSPSFFYIRETILGALMDYMDIIYMEEKSSPFEIESMPEDQRELYLGYKKEKLVRCVADAIMKNPDFFEKFKFSNSDYYASQAYFIPVVKISKIQKEIKRLNEY